jgi:hypothetical protein
MTKEPKTGDRMFELMKSDNKLMEEKYNIAVDEQEVTYSKSWIIFLPVVTCWLAHYHTCARLLKIEGAMHACWARKADEVVLKAGNAEKQERARVVLEPIGDADFSRKLRR